MPRIRTAVFALSLAACGTESNAVARTADTLRTLLTTVDSAPRDTAADRKEDEFQRCVYAWAETSEAKLRECLVVTYRWSPQDAERRQAVYRAKLRREIDSLEQVHLRLLAERQRVQDSITRAQRLAREAAERARIAALYGGRPVPVDTNRTYISDSRTMLLYRTTCTIATRIPVRERDYWDYQDDALHVGIVLAPRTLCDW